MAINIFEGGKSRNSAKTTNAASSSIRAKQAKEALAVPAETSNDGSTAVGSKGILGKVAEIGKKALPIAAKFLPGVAGTVARGLTGIFNDPEWWQAVPGHGITTNAPMAITRLGQFQQQLPEFGIAVPALMRPALVSICSTDIASPVPEQVFSPSDQAITQYLMPEIRRVVNAIPLQTAESYKKVLSYQACAYALWRQLLKYDYLLKHGQTYIPSLNDPAFPILRVENASWLQSAIARLEEYLRANVRLPHTLCEYLAWRYGRVYMAHNTSKSALVVYDVVTPTAPIETFNTVIQTYMSGITATAELQQANTDLYTTYYDHDYMVEIRDDTQFKFDIKEWMLRQNLDFAPATLGTTLNPIVIDSAMDNPTTFMASSVSTSGTSSSGGYDILFPVQNVRAFYYVDTELGFGTATNGAQVPTVDVSTDAQSVQILTRVTNGSRWFSTLIKPQVVGTYPGAPTVGSGSTRKPVTTTNLVNLLWTAAVCKAADIYNAQQYLYVNCNISASDPDPSVLAIDLTAIPYDLGTVTDDVLGNEHVFAFANLVDIDRKHSLSYKAAEKLVAKDVANTVATMDVAAART